MTFGATSSEIDELRGRQADVLTLDQTQRFFEARTVHRRVGRLWQAPHRGVVVLHNGPLTQLQRTWAAVLAAPAGSALWGSTAAALDGFRDIVEDVRVHVVLPVGSRRLPIPWVQSHWSAHLGPADVHPLAEPRRTRIARSLLDLASDARDGRRAAAVLFAGAQQRLVTADMLEEALNRRGHCRHHELILETLADIEGGIHSVPEQDFDRIVRRLGLPQPTRQVIRRRPNGRYYLDVLWEEFGLAVEIDGSHHRSATQWDDDLDRTAVVVAGGLRQIRFSSFAVRRRADRVGDLLMMALQSGGWTG
jgi:very-short-patch-repair endonuclease